MKHTTYDPLRWLAVLVCAGALLVTLWPAPAASGVVKRTDRYVRHAQLCQRMTDRDRSPTPSRRLYARSGPGEFRSWAFRLWRGRARESCQKVRYLNSNPFRAIAYVFGRVGQVAKALSVVRCESNFYTGANNSGTYLGLFQFGPYARSTYGFGATPLDQTWPAFFYWRDAGWSPWECA